MGDAFQNHVPTTNFKAASSATSKKDSKLTLDASSSKSFSHTSLKKIPLLLLNNGKMRKSAAIDVSLFLLKVGALETVRRLSKARYPFVWSGLQALQVLCYPPLKWLQRWDPFRNLIRGAHMLSRPLLVLSIATTFSNQSAQNGSNSDDIENSDRSDLNTVSESHPVLPPTQADINVTDDGEDQSHQASSNWLIDLYRELDKQGLCLPERINEDELRRFHTAANGDFSCLLVLVKKSIRWRETYRILSEEELEMWSNMVFWHGSDVNNRPCLIIRLVACISLPPGDRPRFAQAIVSQVEHGILHLVDAENPQITVLVDCEGLSLRFPMQLLRSCSVTLQENYPNRLGCLFVIRLPPVGRVIAQTFIQVLRPATRQKLKIVGKMYKNTLSEYLQTFPSYLGGECGCSRCSKLSNAHMQLPQFDEFTSNRQLNADGVGFERFNPDHEFGDVNEGCERVLRAAVIGILMVWVLIALIAGIVDPESRPSLEVII
ncbi:phosphatidylinositol/phosphatidylcholine transfer protein SFH9-like [Bidens hawaiensis]|uniref:phosphatidylinositol/phosphatidylcholine transfer protein SFH9-like n=1 Tax=Bidens hawaiensis TaxID=980011 RepID=UPI00404B9FCE